MKKCDWKGKRKAPDSPKKKNHDETNQKEFRGEGGGRF